MTNGSNSKSTTGEVRRDDYRPPPFLVDDATLEFDLDARETRVRTELSIRRNPLYPGEREALHLDGHRMELLSLALNARTLPPGAWTHDASGLTIPHVPDRFTLTTQVALNPAVNTALMGLYQAGAILCTQCEPEAFRRITFFPDRPDVLARFRVTLRADQALYPVLLANGNPISREVFDDGRHQVVWDDPHPKPCYLFALVAGDLEQVGTTYTTASGREVSIHLHVEPADTGRCEHALNAVRRAMAWDEARYGREYDLDVLNLVAVSAYTMGAMENKGLNIFNDRYVLADPQTATDADLRTIEALVAHEYFHNWTGNRITCRDWFQVGLKEGLTVFREQQFTAEQGWGDLRRVEDVRLMRTRQFTEDAGPMAHPVRPFAYREIENFFTDTVYGKGAELVRMLATLLGQRAFHAGMERYFRLHDGCAVTVEDFVDCMAAASDRDLRQFLAWYDQCGTPELRVSSVQDRKSGRFGLRVAQRRPDGDAPLHIPLAVGFLDEAGDALAVRGDGEPTAHAGTRVLELRDSERTFWFSDVEASATPALLRGCSAPVRATYPYEDAALKRLGLRDPDPVVRWDAVQRLAGRAVGRHLEGDDGGLAPLGQVLSGLLADAGADAGLVAECLELPDERSLGSSLRSNNVDALVAGRRWLLRRLGAGLAPDLLASHERCIGRASPEHAPQPAGWRALKSACLGYLLHARQTGATALCYRQYTAGQTMTERLAALQLLAHTHSRERIRALADYRHRYRRDPAMMDRWLSVQARSRRYDVVERVRTLLADPSYSIRQPNRVRSLIEVFCSDNLPGFHRPDGAGYRLLSEQVRTIDPVNPALAAALARHLVDAGWVNQERRRHLQRELARIASSGGLSGGTREVVAAGLGLPELTAGE